MAASNPLKPLVERHLKQGHSVQSLITQGFDTKLINDTNQELQTLLETQLRANTSEATLKGSGFGFVQSVIDAAKARIKQQTEEKQRLEQLQVQFEQQERERQETEERERQAEAQRNQLLLQQQAAQERERQLAAANAQKAATTMSNAKLAYDLGLG